MVDPIERSTDCVDPDDVDFSVLHRRASGETVDARTSAKLDDHLARCPHCQNLLDTLADEIRRHTARDPEARRQTLDALLEAARTLDEARPTMLRPRRGWMRWWPAATIAAAAVVASVWISFGNRAGDGPPALVVEGLGGGLRTTMGSDQPAARANFAPDGLVRMTVRFEREATRREIPQIAGFVVRAGQLVPIDAAHLEVIRRPGWVAAKVRLPVRDVLGERPGDHDLWFVASFSRDLGDLAGRPATALEGEPDISARRVGVHVVSR